MRSRFTAFALQDEAHLLRSWHPSTRPATVQLVSGQRWTGLEVLATIGGEMLDKEGDVEFRATYERRGRPGTLHELSRFVRHEGLWARSEEHTSELQSLMRISYAVFCLKKKKRSIPK